MAAPLPSPSAGPQLARRDVQDANIGRCAFHSAQLGGASTNVGLEWPPVARARVGEAFVTETGGLRRETFQTAGGCNVAICHV